MTMKLFLINFNLRSNVETDEEYRPDILLNITSYPSVFLVTREKKLKASIEKTKRCVELSLAPEIGSSRLKWKLAKDNTEIEWAWDLWDAGKKDCRLARITIVRWFI